jgi:hypothetical protein
LDAFLANLGICVAQKFPIEVMNSAYTAWCAYKGDHPGASGPGSAFDSLYIGVKFYRFRTIYLMTPGGA